MVTKEKLEEQIQELKVQRDFATDRMEKAYDEISKLRLENYKLKKKLHMFPPDAVKKNASKI